MSRWQDDPAVREILDEATEKSYHVARIEQEMTLAVAAYQRCLREQIQERLDEVSARYDDSDEAQDGAGFELQAVLALLDIFAALAAAGFVVVQPDQLVVPFARRIAEIRYEVTLEAQRRMGVSVPIKTLECDRQMARAVVALLKEQAG